MSWAPQDVYSGRRGQPVTSQDLEERINMYISAMDKASSQNDESMGAQLQRDIQHLVDLMDKVGSGQVVMDTEVPPPLVMTPNLDAVANPLGLLSSRLSDYHKALYFAEEELTEIRLKKINDLQKGLQAIHALQKRAQAGFPIKEDEIPPPVDIPSDSEFDSNALNTITTRLAHYRNYASSSNRKVESHIQKLELLLTRAKAKRPVWHRDIPPAWEELCGQGPESLANLMETGKGLQERVCKLQVTNPELQTAKDTITEGLDILMTKWTKEKTFVPTADHTNLSNLSSMVQSLEQTAEFESKRRESLDSKREQDLATITSRIQEYKSAALQAKREGGVSQAIQHLKVVKGLQPMQDALERGEKVDMTLVPPPPRDMTPVGEAPPSFARATTGAGATGTSAGGSIVGNSSGDAAVAAAAVAPVPSAHAQVSPFSLKQTVETAEDKLARKLTSFLEDESGGGAKSFASSVSSTSSSSSSPAHQPAAFDEEKAAAKVPKELLESEKGGGATVTTTTRKDDSPGSDDAESSDLTDVSSVLDDSPAPPNKPADSSAAAEGIDSSSLNNNEGGSLSQEMKSSAEEARSLMTDGDDTTITTISTTSSTQSSGLSSDPSSKTNSDEASTVVVEENEHLRNHGNDNSGHNSPAGEKSTNVENVKSSSEEEKNGMIGSQLKPVTSLEDKKEGNTKDGKSISESKSPLDAIGFLSCQDVPDTGDKVTGLSLAHNPSSPSHTRYQQPTPSTEQQSQNKTDVENSLENRTGSSPVMKEVGPSSPLENRLKVSNDSGENENFSSSSYNTDSDLKSSESMTGLSLPYSVNIPSNSENESSNQNHPASQAAVPPTNVRDYYSLSGNGDDDDDRGFEDSSDMKEFQDLMDSMAPSSEKSASNEISSTSSDRLPSSTFSSTTIPSLPESLGAADNVSQNTQQHTLRPSFSSSTSNNTTNASSSLHHQQQQQPSTLHHQPNNSLDTSSDQDQNCLTVGVSSSSLSHGVEWTGMETLKYDMILASSQASEHMKSKAERLLYRMEQMKNCLRKGGRKVWEEYKECLEKELQELNDGLKKHGDSREWDIYKYLNNKRMLNERELSYLKQHIAGIQN